MNGLNQKYNKQELINLMTGVKGLVIHNDIDGLLSGLYMNQKYNIPIVGVIELGSDDGDMGTFLLNKEFNNKRLWDEVVFLDCGIITDAAKVIDHHLSPAKYYNERKINYHKNFSKTKNIWDKCPINNIMWLMAIHKDSPLNYTGFQQALILSADGTHKNYVKYNDNTKYALDILNLNDFEPIIKEMGNRRFDGGDEFLGMSFPFFSCLNNLKSHSNLTIQEVGKKIQKEFQWNNQAFSVSSTEHFNLSTQFCREDYLSPENPFTYTSVRKDQFRITKLI